MRDGRRRDRADEHLRGRAGERRAAVVLGHPVAVEAERVAQPGEVDRVAQRVRAGRALGHRRLVEHAEPHAGEASNLAFVRSRTRERLGQRCPCGSGGVVRRSSPRDPGAPCASSRRSAVAVDRCLRLRAARDGRRPADPRQAQSAQRLAEGPDPRRRAGGRADGRGGAQPVVPGLPGARASAPTAASSTPAGCTANFIFSDGTDWRTNPYIGTASHCTDQQRRARDHAGRHDDAGGGRHRLQADGG